MRAYLELAKPERTLTNVLTALAGYLFASKWHLTWRLLALLLGSTLIIAAACVFNNVLDRRLDKRMGRTKKRVLVSGRVTVSNALIYGTLLGAAGFWALSYTNRLTLIIGALAFISYVLLYGAAKRYSIHGTLVGTVPGGASLVAGYSSVTNRLDLTALLLFLAMLAWQMAHFYAIAIYRYDDYKAAELPVMPVKTSVHAAKIQIIFYIIFFIITAGLITPVGHAGYIYLVAVVVLGIWWLLKALHRYTRSAHDEWGRGVFFFSLRVITVFSILVAVARILP